MCKWKQNWFLSHRERSDIIFISIDKNDFTSLFLPTIYRAVKQQLKEWKTGIRLMQKVERCLDHTLFSTEDNQHHRWGGSEHKSGPSRTSREASTAVQVKGEKGLGYSCSAWLRDRPIQTNELEPDFDLVEGAEIWWKENRLCVKRNLKKLKNQVASPFV